MRYIKIFSKFIVVICLMAPIINLLSYETVQVKFYLEDNKQNAVYQIFYLDGQEDRFNEDMSIHKATKIDLYGEKYIEINLPIHELKGLRLDFADHIENVILKKVMVEGKDSICLYDADFNEIMLNGIREEMEKDVRTFVPINNDPHIVFQMSQIHTYCKKVYDWLPILSIGILSYVFVNSFTNYLFRLKGKETVLDLYFCCIIIVLLFVPIIKIDSSQIKNNENRNLAVKPYFVENGVINILYGKQFEEWLNDRFGFRDDLIGVYYKIERILSNRFENEKAFEGKEHWLFYKGDRSVELYQNINRFTDNEMEKIQQNLENRKKWFNEQGIEFFVVIPPDKNSVYGEYYKPDIMKKGGGNRIQELVEYLSKNQTSMQINYLLDTLLVHKEDGILYWKNDTHWNEYGAYLGYLSLMKDIQKAFPEIKELTPNEMDFDYKMYPIGDLSIMLNIEDISAYEDKYLAPVLKGGYHFTYIKNEEKNGVITKNTAKKLKVLVFRDSFSNLLIPYLSETFGEVEYIWSHDINEYQEKIIQDKPDIVIHEVVSRFAQSLLKDTPELREETK